MDEPMKTVALQAIADMKLTGNLPADLQVNKKKVKKCFLKYVNLQEQLLQLETTATKEFENCEKLQLLIWRYKTCMAFQSKNVHNTLKAIQNEALLRETTTAAAAVAK